MLFNTTEAGFLFGLHTFRQTAGVDVKTALSAIAGHQPEDDR
jgi:hypothetical protein